MVLDVESNKRLQKAQCVPKVAAIVRGLPDSVRYVDTPWQVACVGMKECLNGRIRLLAVRYGVMQGGHGGPAQRGAAGGCAPGSGNRPQHLGQDVERVGTLHLSRQSRTFGLDDPKGSSVGLEGLGGGGQGQLCGFVLDHMGRMRRWEERKA
jgi:hypothetical protein